MGNLWFGRPSPGSRLRRFAGLSHRDGRGVIGLLVGATMLLAACAPAPAQRSQTSPDAAKPAGPPKTLRIGSIREPVDGIALFGGNGDANAQYGPIFHAGLTAYDSHGALVPRL